MNYRDEYLAAANTNPELVIDRAEPPITLQIDTDELARVMADIWARNHPDD